MKHEFEFRFDVLLLREARNGCARLRFDDAIPVNFFVLIELLVADLFGVHDFEHLAEDGLELGLFGGIEFVPTIPQGALCKVVVIGHIIDESLNFGITIRARRHFIQLNRIRVSIFHELHRFRQGSHVRNILFDNSRRGLRRRNILCKSGNTQHRKGE